MISNGKDQSIRLWDTRKMLSEHQYRTVGATPQSNWCALPAGLLQDLHEKLEHIKILVDCLAHSPLGLCALTCITHILQSMRHQGVLCPLSRARPSKAGCIVESRATGLLCSPALSNAPSCCCT